MSRIGNLSTALNHQYALVRDLQDALRRGDDTDALVARDRGAFHAAARGDADALAVALQNGSEGAAGDGLSHAACHADPACVRLILEAWGAVLSVYFIDQAVQYAAQRGHVETLRALLPYWGVNDRRRADMARWTHDETCSAMLLGTAEVAV